ncbi:MAG: AAA family ATPase [Deltaproteobacteria bacterium]|nr:AAA family ATPase [Myxococcales bacterium]MDP3214539.1 AAA family ATPase [Deltaproteobacteria bacterium]
MQEAPIHLLRSLRVRGWRSFAPDNGTGLDALGHVNIIAGINNTGKSNYLRFLLWLLKAGDRRVPGEPANLSLVPADCWRSEAAPIEAEIGFDARALGLIKVSQEQVDLGATAPALVDPHGTIRILVRTGKIEGKWQFSADVLLSPHLAPDFPPTPPPQISLDAHRTYHIDRPTEKGRGRRYVHDPSSGEYVYCKRDEESPEYYLGERLVAAFFYLLGQSTLLLEASRRDEDRREAGDKPETFQGRQRPGDFRRDPTRGPLSTDGTGIVSRFFSLNQTEDIEQGIAFKTIRDSLEKSLKRWLADPGLGVASRTDSAGVHLTLRAGNGHELALDDLGSGVAELVLQHLYLLMRRHRRPSHSAALPILLLIDDVECHLHPAIALDFVREVSREVPECQILCTSHSSVLMDGIRDGWTLFHTEQDATGRTHTFPVLKEPDRRRFVAALGVTPSQLALSSVVLWVEGPTDIIYLRRLLKDVGANEDLLEVRDYSFVVYGGGLVSFVGFEKGYPETLVDLLSVCPKPIVVCDRDCGFDSSGRPDNDCLKGPVGRLWVAAQKDHPGAVHVTPGREVENLLLPAALSRGLREVFHSLKEAPDMAVLQPSESFVEAAAAHFGISNSTIQGYKRKLATIIAEDTDGVFNSEAVAWGKLLADAIRDRRR